MEATLVLNNYERPRQFNPGPFIKTVDYEPSEPIITSPTEDVDDLPISDVEEEINNPHNTFILGNTQEISIQDLHEKHLIPCFTKSGEECISMVQFINTVYLAAQKYYQGQTINPPIIRVSHENRLRTIHGAGKLVSQLEENDYGTYFSRCMFLIEIPSIITEINGNLHSLMICGVRNYDDTNLLSNGNSQEPHKLAVGFLNHACCNGTLCTDGLMECIKVNNTLELEKHAIELFNNFNYKKFEAELKALCHTQISESQFCTILGRARLYSYLPISIKEELGIKDLLILPEAQFNSVTRDYIDDPNFQSYGGELNAYKMLNLLTGFKNSQIDKSLIRTANAYEFVKGITEAINGVSDRYSWFLE